MGDFLSLDWAERVRSLLDANSEFRNAARALSGTIYLHDQEGGVSLRFNRGVVLDIRDGADPRGSTWRIGGTSDAWQRLLMDEVDVFQAIDARVGELTLDGDVIGLAGNARAFMMLWDALRRATRD